MVEFENHWEIVELWEDMRDQKDGSIGPGNT
jgi:hypothetical protein